jgi:hypothetical protein
MEQEFNQQEMSQEELIQKKEEMYQFYTESLKYLDAQLKYEETLAKIDEARFKRLTIQMQHAMMMNPPDEAELNSQEESKDQLQEELTESNKRRLRKQ